MKGSSFTFGRIDLLEYHLHKISLNRDSSYIDCPRWIKNKGVTINPKNTEDNNCFQYAIITALNYQNIDHHPERISKLKPFISNCNWDSIDFPAGHKDYSAFQKNNIAINIHCNKHTIILYVPHNTKQIKQAYISKHNNERDTHANLLMITDGTGNWYYLAAKSISGLLRGITLNHNGDFYCLSCFHLYTTEKKLRKHERICKDHDFCDIKMPDEDNKILKYISGEKSLRAPFTIYADLECLLRKINTCQNNPDKSYIEKKATHRPSGYSLVTCCSFDKSKTECNYYRGKDCMKIFCKDLKDQAEKIINYEKKGMIPLTDEEKESYENQKIGHICEKEFSTDNKDEKYHKVRDHCHYTGKYRGATHNNCNLRYKIPKEIPVVFHNRFTYDYHFIIKYVAREFKANFESMGENTEKSITFSVPIKKEHDNGKPSIYRLKFIDSCGFMQSSLSNLVDNLSEIHNKGSKNKFTDRMRSMTDLLSQSIDKVSTIDKKISQNKFIDSMRSMIFSLTQSIDKVSEIDRKISQIDKKEPDNTFTDSIRSMINSLSQSINKISEIDNDISQIDNKFTGNTRSMISSLSQSIDKISEINNKISQDELFKKFPNTYQLCNKNLNKFELLLQKGVYPYEHMEK